MNILYNFSVRALFTLHFYILILYLFWFVVAVIHSFETAATLWIRVCRCVGVDVWWSMMVNCLPLGFLVHRSYHFTINIIHYSYLYNRQFTSSLLIDDHFVLLLLLFLFLQTFNLFRSFYLSLSHTHTHILTFIHSFSHSFDLTFAISLFLFFFLSVIWFWSSAILESY